jgi:Terminase large subunit, T4likevirus-type, N-terminal
MPHDVITPLWMMKRLGYDPPDPWQVEALESTRKRILMNCCRQAGKSTVVAVIGLVEALTNPMHNVLILSRSLRQSREVFLKCIFFHELFQGRLKKRRSAHELTLTNYSRIVCLPCKEETVRGFSKVNLLIMDEAARVPDDLYRAVRPMLAVSDGRMICLSTPFGKRGFFYKEWAEGGDEWLRISVAAHELARIPRPFLEQERRSLGESFYRQEYCCSFEALQGLVFPEMAKCLVDELPRELADAFEPGRAGSRAQEGEEPLEELDMSKRYTMSDDEWDEKVRERMARWKRLSAEKGDWRYDMPPWIAERYGETPTGPSAPRRRGSGGDVQWVGGIDFGFRNPFAAVWGMLDADGVLWLVGEHYKEQQPLSYHMHRMPRHVTWYADPSGAGEIAELQQSGFTVRRGKNELRAGIAWVNARIKTGGLKILQDRCPRLLHEAELHRYSDKPGDRGEAPEDDHNHALAALRYLISRLQPWRGCNSNFAA